ncbi:MAG TPA: site-specific DNA-methyltransferase [Candidatus Binatia bacterium]|nr:site-specific DNA-methyltransferase [Candidatus Binatia bacterium]
MNQNLKILNGDCREVMRQIDDESVQTCVTSPPYWRLRSYLPPDHPNKGLEIGQEKTPEAYVQTMRQVFSEVWRVMKKDGTVWLNLGDSYSGSGKGGTPGHSPHIKQHTNSGSLSVRGVKRNGLKPKDLIGVPWLVAFALQSDGWYLRSDIIWHKPNPMPESVTDRPTRSHEYIFLLTKSERYYYDAAAIREPASPDLIKQVEEGYNGHALKDYLAANVQDASATKARIINGARKRIDKQRGHSRRHAGFNDEWDALTPAEQALLGSNKRDVWSVAPANYREAHFATFPPDLIKPCILAGTKPGDVVLDPFGGSGTTARVAIELGRKAVICELNNDYIPLIEQRTNITAGLKL